MFKNTKNNKIKNTGILFEILVKKITSQIMQNKQKLNGLTCFKKIFNNKSQMYKEWLLYKTLITQQQNLNSNNINQLLNNINQKRLKYINQDKLNKQKYIAIKYIKEYYDLKQFFNIQLQNYKKYASVYKYFEGIKEPHRYDPVNLMQNKKVVCQNLLNVNINNKTKNISQELQILLRQPKEVRFLANQLMIKNYNKKYQSLTKQQKQLIQLYMQKNHNKRQFYHQFKNRTKQCSSLLYEIINNKRKLLNQIQYKKIVNMLQVVEQKVINGRKITQNNINMLMNMYELTTQLNKIQKD